MPPCTHCGCATSVPCWGCEMGLTCLGPCPSCLQPDTDKLPRVSILLDGSATFSGDLDDGFPKPDADLTPLPSLFVPF